MPKSALAASVGLAILAGLLLMPHGQAQQDALNAQLAEDVAAADTIVVCVARASKPVKGSGDAIHNDLTLQPTKRLKGSQHSAQDFAFRITGGTVAGITEGASHVVQVTKGDKLLLMLDANGKIYGQLGGIFLLLHQNDSLYNEGELGVTLADVEALL